MKKIKYLLLIFLGLVFGACSSDDGEGAKNESALVIGTYTLTEVNVSIPQDVNEDGIASTNMLDELDCLNGKLVVSADGTWNIDMVELYITSVTGDFYATRCGRTINYTGKWSFESNILDLNSYDFKTMQMNSSELTENINGDLPGILNRKFTK